MRQIFIAACLLAADLLVLAPPPARAGSGWAALPNAPVIIGRHDDVFFVNPDLGWVVNGAGRIYRTTDGGESFALQAEEPVYFRSVGFADPLKGWAGTLDSPSILYATTNGGETWTLVGNIPQPRPTGICGIWVVNAAVAYACGRYDGPARMIKTTNGGTTWTSSDLSAHATTLIDCFFFDENRGFMVGGIGSTFGNRRAVILGTTDGGATWTTRHTTNRTGEWSWKISFPTPDLGYVSIERFSGSSFFLKTTDGGETWQDFFFLNNYEEQGIGFATTDFGWIGGHDGATYESTDAGMSWHPAGFGLNINRFRFLSETLGYAVGETVYKYTLNTAGVTEEIASLPAPVLAQNYPNPFRRSTSIAYTLGRESQVRMTIHDAQGRRVSTLLAGSLPAGRHELRWDARDGAGNSVPAGVYWYRLETGEGDQVKKLLIVKGE